MQNAKHRVDVSSKDIEKNQKKSQEEANKLLSLWPDKYIGTAEDARELIWGSQNFATSNNINLFELVDQFGNRLPIEKVSESPRYIRRSQVSRLIFRPEDGIFCEDGQNIASLPIIPMELVNGCEAERIDMRFHNHNPFDVIKNIRQMIAKEEPDFIHPWYKNFKGSIDYISEQRYITSGNLAIIGDNKIEITELPLGVSTQIYKENVLEPLLHGSDKTKPIINEYKEYHTDTTVRFVCQIDPNELKRIQAEGAFHQKFKLYSFLTFGREFYDKRKPYLESKLEAMADKLSEQARFIVEEGYTIIFESETRKDAIDELIKKGYRSDPIKAWQNCYQNEDEQTEQTGIENNKLNDPEKPFKTIVGDYDYLYSMPINMLTKENKNKLLTQKKLKLDQLAALRANSVKMLWLENLDALEYKLNKLEKQECLDERDVNTKQSKVVTGDDQIFPSSKGTKINFQITKEILEEIIKKEKTVKKEKTLAMKKVADDSSDIDQSSQIKRAEPQRSRILTKEHINELLRQKKLILDKLAALRAKSAGMLWLEDLDELESKLIELQEQERLEERTKHSKAVTGDVQFFPSSKGTKVNFQITKEILKEIHKNSNINAFVTKKKGFRTGLKKKFISEWY